MSEKNNKLKLFYRKVKFLIPILIASSLALIIFNLGSFDANLIGLVVSIYVIALLLSGHYWKFERDTEYRKEGLKREKEQKALPWQRRNSSAQLRINLEGLRVCAFILAIAAFVKGISYIFDGLFFHASVTFFASIFCYLVVRAINKMKI